MTSQIDPTLPVTGEPTTASVRQNFQTAHDEITALQSAAGAITASEVAISPAIGALGANVQTGLATLNSTMAPLASPPFSGNPTAPTPSPGDNDQSLATTAFVQAAVAPSLHNVGRSLIHNGLFNIAQRGAGPWTTNTYTVDRWLLNLSTDTATASVVAITDANRSVIGDEAAVSSLYTNFTGTSGAPAQTYIMQKIEGVRRLSGKTVTVSFYAAASGVLKVGINAYQFFGSGGSPSAGIWAQATGAAVTLGGSFARYSATLTIPSTIGKTFGTNADDSTWLALWYSSGANDNALAGNIGVQSGGIQLWGVQLEIGSVMTPLEKPDPQQDLAKCQRFYQLGGINLTQHVYLAAGWASTMVGLPVSMRATPSVVPTWTTEANTTTPNTYAVSLSSLVLTTQATAPGAMQLVGTFTASADL